MAAPKLEQLAALVRLWNHACSDTGQAGVCARALLGLYNGPRFKFDLTELRRLDADLLRDVFCVLAMDANPQREVHELLNVAHERRDFGARFEHLAYEWNVHGAVASCDLPPLGALFIDLPVAADVLRRRAIAAGVL